MVTAAIGRSEEAMQARAYIRGLSISPRKMRVVANIVRGKSVEEAVGLLDLMPKKAAQLIAKAVKSAAANAEDQSGGDVSVEDLHVATITVDGGPIQKRWMPRSMGRANRIQHRTSHLTVVVSDDQN
jgi:large subunit ribosomal protein L22